jgi:4-hydroxy-3-methylbut-2-en-1-yl diphosphate reductase
MIVNIDENSGFCFGVVNAIKKAEEELEKSGFLYCLGDIVHNNAEVGRLKSKGLQIINYDQFIKLKNCKVLIRAHGEPPETYETAKKNNIQLIDASCKVVLKLQSRISKSYINMGEDGQLVIFGKEGHAEVNGLVGQTNNNAIIARKSEDLNKIDFSKPVSLFSQTTMSISEFRRISEEIRQGMIKARGNQNVPLTINDTICGQVSNRAPHLQKFAARHDVILFVCGNESSNGKVLYDICKSVNNNSYIISDKTEIKKEWIKSAKSVGICGATSTPKWLMEEVAEFINTPPRV